MPPLLADFTHARDCKLNLRKNVDTTRPQAWHKNSRTAKGAVRDVTEVLTASTNKRGKIISYRPKSRHNAFLQLYKLPFHIWLSI